MLSTLRSAGISEAEFSRQVGESQQTVNNWKRRELPASKAVKIARAIGCSVEWLLEGAGDTVQGYRIAESDSLYEHLINHDAVYLIAGQVFKATKDTGKVLTEEKFSDVVKLAHRDMLDRHELSVPYARIMGLVNLCG